jgi:hypothetical protein
VRPPVVILKAMVLLSEWSKQSKKHFASTANCMIGFTGIAFCLGLLWAIPYELVAHVTRRVLTVLGPILFGRHPIVGSHVGDVINEPVDLDDPHTDMRHHPSGSRVVKTNHAVQRLAFDNLAIAQHRDTLHYAHTPAIGDFLIKLRRFEEGDLRRQPTDSMDPKTRLPSTIYAGNDSMTSLNKVDML